VVIGFSKRAFLAGLLHFPNPKLHFLSFPGECFSSYLERRVYNGDTSAISGGRVLHALFFLCFLLLALLSGFFPFAVHRQETVLSFILFLRQFSLSYHGSLRFFFLFSSPLSF